MATKSELIGIMETVCLVIKQAILMVFPWNTSYTTVHGFYVQPNQIIPGYNKTVHLKGTVLRDYLVFSDLRNMY